MHTDQAKRVRGPLRQAVFVGIAVFNFLAPDITDRTAQETRSQSVFMRILCAENEHE